jgi:hypothetical protein
VSINLIRISQWGEKGSRTSGGMAQGWPGKDKDKKTYLSCPKH